MVTQPSPGHDADVSTPVQEARSPTDPPVGRDGVPVAGYEPGRASPLPDPIRLELRAVEEALADLPPGPMNWLQQHGAFPWLMELRADFHRTLDDSRRCLPDELDVLASRVRSAGDRFNQRQACEQSADRVEQASARLRTFLDPAWSTRLIQTIRDYLIL